MLQDIKTAPMTSLQVDAMIALSGSATALFSKRARKYKELELKQQHLTEDAIRGLILSEYTFLKRPVLIFEEHIFIGNSAKEVDAARTFLSTK